MQLKCYQFASDPLSWVNADDIVTISLLILVEILDIKRDNQNQLKDQIWRDFMQFTIGITH